MFTLTCSNTSEHKQTGQRLGTLLEEAHVINGRLRICAAGIRGKRLRSFTLSGREVKSLAGLESFEQLEQLTLLNLRMQDLSSLRELPRLTALTLRMPAGGLDLASVAVLPRLRSLVIDDAAITDSEVFRV